MVNVNMSPTTIEVSTDALHGTSRTQTQLAVAERLQPSLPPLQHNRCWEPLLPQSQLPQTRETNSRDHVSRLSMTGVRKVPEWHDMGISGH